MKKPIGILMLHGFPSNPGYFLPLEAPIRALDLPHRIPPLRGLGAESPQALLGVTWHDWLEDAEAALQDLLTEAEKAIVIGHSMGGGLAIPLAAKHAAQLDSLVLGAAEVQLSSPFAPGKPFNFLVPVLGLFLSRWEFPVGKTDFYRKSYTWAPKGAFLSMLDLSRKVLPYLPEITIPVLLIQGRKDDAIAPENMDMIYNGISTPPRWKRKIWFEETAHDLLHDCEHEMVMQAIMQHIRERIGAG